jgi:malate/lactate dehydrogenase
MVAVLTNPVDLMTAVVQTMLPNATVFGLGMSLDAARLAHVLGRVTEQKVDGSMCPVGGEHGRRLIPFLSRWDGALLASIRKKKLVAETLQEAAELGVRIVRDLGYTVHDCGIVFAEDIAWMLGHGGPERVVSTWRGSAAIGVPVRRTTRGQFRICEDVERGEKREVDRQEAALGRLVKLVLEDMRRGMFR